MSLLSEGEARRRAKAYANARNLSVPKALQQQARRESPRYDIFLSQAIKDREIVLGVYAILTEDLDLNVFCDWMDDPANDHAITTSGDAAYLRHKLQASKALIFIDSENAQQSTWMSWEIGWFDAAKGRICVLPVTTDNTNGFRGREFLGLYPMAEREERYGFVVGVPFEKVAARFPPGTPLGVATRFPLAVWASMEALPAYFLR
jgi:hypothetical protein